MSTQKNRASEQTKSSTIIPAAPTTTRWRVSVKADAADASTYGIGISTRNMMPISWTSPPQALTAHACPNSCISLSTGKVSHISTRFCGARTLDAMSSVSSPQCPAAWKIATPTVAHQTIAPNHPNNGLYQGSHRSSTRSGSNSGILTASGDSSALSHGFLACRRARRSNSARSGVTSDCSSSAAWSCPRSRITSSCVGASSPKRVVALAQISCNVRRPSIRPTT